MVKALLGLRRKEMCRDRQVKDGEVAFYILAILLVVILIAVKSCGG
jgi:hypothetical protein